MAEFDRRSYIVRRADISRFSHDATIALNVAAGESYSYSVYAPVGSVCRTQVVMVEVVNPAGALSGTHALMVWSSYNLLYGKSNYNKYVSYYYGYWVNADVLAQPSDQAASALMGRDVLFTDVAPLVVYYFNNTDVVNTSSFLIRLTAERQVV